MIFRDQPIAITDARRQVCDHHLLPESHCIKQLLHQVTLTDSQRQEIQALAFEFVDSVRHMEHSPTGIAAFLSEYTLSSQEGVLLLCLAESLLRIPDTETADALIRDKLTQADWESHIGRSDSWLVNAGTWGLMLTGKVVDIDKEFIANPLELVKKLVSRISEPVVRAATKEAMRIMSNQFVLGQNIQQALQRSQNTEYQHSLFSFDMLGEAAVCQAHVDKYYHLYSQAIDAVAETNEGATLFASNSLSIKLSALHARYEGEQRVRILDELYHRLKSLVVQAMHKGVAVTLDAEESSTFDLNLDLFEKLIGDPELEDWNGVGVVVQAYQKRSLAYIEYLANLAAVNDKIIPVRLVKGAYWDTEIKRAQVMGLKDYPVFTQKPHTDLSYLVCAQKLLAHQTLFYPQFATHNAHTAASILKLAGPCSDFELQRLQGMGESLFNRIKHKFPKVICRVYAPVGEHRDLLPYLVRRLLENGANSSIVNRISDARLPIESVIEDPLQSVRSVEPASCLALPQDIYAGERKNSTGLDASDLSDQFLLYEQTHAWRARRWSAQPLINGVEMEENSPSKIVSPANTEITVGYVVHAHGEQARKAMDIAHSASFDWDASAAHYRAQCLLRVADALQQHWSELLTLIVMEGGRCINDALNEIREAIDFCRYYACLAERQFSRYETLQGPTGEINQLSLHGRGVFVCISPWNFPLAIFVGQISAALASGNCVVAKPSSFTALTAYRTIQIFHQCGVPFEVLHFVPGRGEHLSAALLQHDALAGVAFTGSTEVAQNINRMLAQRSGAIVPLIAETGGLNCMIVDSSALPEQVVKDVVQSAFNSAGQRCSALRVLFVQSDIYPSIISLLSGAIEQLQIGDPQYLDTDVGPLIDQKARDNFHKHWQWLRNEADLIHCGDLDPHLQAGYFVTPCVYALQSLAQLKYEVFAPALHVIRYRADQLGDVIDSINESRYGLTLGIHSRIESRVTWIQNRVRVGNTYVNRNMIGATVGVQPFGGEGLSGTGPKAGGPHYLYRFSTERVISINSAAIGGDASLLAQQ